VEAVQLLVTGIVQGVGFRYWTERSARQLGLTGWVRNLYDGRVEILAEGEKAALDELERKAKTGPPGAEVESIERRERQPLGQWARFAILPDADRPEV
jgi:acylphosphatase